MWKSLGNFETAVNNQGLRKTVITKTSNHWKPPQTTTNHQQTTINHQQTTANHHKQSQTRNKKLKTTILKNILFIANFLWTYIVTYSL